MLKRCICMLNPLRIILIRGDKMKKNYIALEIDIVSFSADLLMLSGAGNKPIGEYELPTVDFV